MTVTDSAVSAELCCLTHCIWHGSAYAVAISISQKHLWSEVKGLGPPGRPRSNFNDVA